jgi:hypothetical protein
MSELALGCTQSVIQCTPGFLSVGVKQFEHETDHIAASTAKVKNEWSYASMQLCACISFWWWQCVWHIHTYCIMGLPRNHKFIQFWVHQLD